MSISAPLAQVLMAGRAQFNARAAEARRRYRALDTGAFADFLGSGVDSVVRAVFAAAPDRLASVVLVAYDIALELVGQGLAGPGARSRFVDEVWRELIPRFAKLVAQQPVEVLAALSNAALNIDKIPGARSEQWLGEMTKLSSHIDTLDRLQAVGQILAWRAGLAHYRAGALRAAAQLPNALALAALGAGAQEHADVDWQAIRDKLLSDPWWSPANGMPEGEIKVGAPIEQQIGKFTGFGGNFAQPPSVRACEDGFAVKSADRYYFLMADAYGAVLLSGSKDEFEGATGDLQIEVPPTRGSQLMLKRHTIELELPPGKFSLACNAHTVAVFSPYSHGIRLFPLQ
ncbi:hypothetical protein BH11PSE11_BH11PSE11_33060 [soil metagenome]